VKITRYEDILSVDEAIADNEPLLAVISFNGSEAIVSHADEAVEYHILLKKTGKSGADIDKYFRIVFDRDGADWTFICPPDYKNIADKTRRIVRFYDDGFTVISEFLTAFGCPGEINIPKRYRRHMEFISEE